MVGLVLVAAGTAALCFLGWLESFLHQRNLRRIPIRIHVNGTRGKSGVTRLIAAGLRAGGIRTFAKTTGTLARAIFPDGTEYPIFRPGRTNVIEQTRMIGIAAEQNVDAMVIECMALHPTLQSLCELKFVQSTHGVITNTRADHLDVMGPTAADVADAIASTVPVNGKLFTTERKYLPTLQNAAVDRDSNLVALNASEVAEVTQAELEKFSYVAHAENVALALRVCAELGVSRETALQGMWSAEPDPGVMKVLHVRKMRKRIAFVNGFAANDPESTGYIWNMMLARHENMQTRIAIINCRHDRRCRSVQLAQAVNSWQPADHYILIGTGTEIFRQAAIDSGLSELSMVCLEDVDSATLVEEIEKRSGDSAIVMGMGNTAGPGLKLFEYLEDLPSQRQAQEKRRTQQPAQTLQSPSSATGKAVNQSGNLFPIAQTTNTSKKLLQEAA